MGLIKLLQQHSPKSTVLIDLIGFYNIKSKRFLRKAKLFEAAILTFHYNAEQNYN